MPLLVRDFGTELAGGVGAFLASRGLVSWDDFGADPYPEDVAWPVVIGPTMPSSPDRLVCITPGISQFARMDVIQAVQVRIRGRAPALDEGPRPAIEEVALLAQNISDAFRPAGRPLTHATLGAVRVGIVMPGDILPVDADTTRRSGSIQNFRIRARRVVPVITPPSEYLPGLGGAPLGAVPLGA